MGHYTDAPEDNLLGLTDEDALNEQEALGVARMQNLPIAGYLIKPLTRDKITQLL